MDTKSRIGKKSNKFDVAAINLPPQPKDNEPVSDENSHSEGQSEVLLSGISSSVSCSIIDFES